MRSSSWQDTATVANKNVATPGFTQQTGEYGDLVTLGIIDPTKVVRTALQDAASIAGMIVTTEATITEHPKEAPALPPGVGMGGMDY